MDRSTYLVILVYRIAFLLFLRTSFVPDEYFQVLEPAFTLVYSVGFRFEYFGFLYLLRNLAYIILYCFWLIFKGLGNGRSIIEYAAISLCSHLQAYFDFCKLL